MSSPTRPHIVYLHGFNSSPASKKAQVLSAWLAERGLDDAFSCPALPNRAEAAGDVIKHLIERLDAPPCLIGSSLGGFFATWAAERFNCRAILVNPSVRPYERFHAYLGPQRNLYTGEEYMLTLEHVEELAVMQPSRIAPSRYWLMVETADETLDYREAVKFYAGCQQTVIEGGDHGFQSWDRMLPEIVRWAGLEVAG